MKSSTFILISFFCLTTVDLAAQSFAPVAGEYFSRNDKSWYNRKTGITRYLIHIQEGEAEKAIQQANDHEGDVEADFVRAIAYAHLGESDKAMKFVKASLEKELPFGRYLAGDLDLLKPLRAMPDFQSMSKELGPVLVHGPMPGAVKDREAAFWCRTDEERIVEVQVSTDKSFRKVKSGRGRTSATNGYATTIKVDQLKPQTRYYYRMVIDDALQKELYTFSTTPKMGKPSRFSVVFGGGAAYIPWQHHMWSTIHAHRPDALFLLGDNVYIDYPKRPEIQQYCYQRRQSEPHFRNLVSHTPTYAIWDDHDFGDNDEYGTPDPNYPPWKPAVLKVFKDQWVDPGYGGAEQLPGVFFQHSIGDVDFFFLDGRYYRQPSEVGATPSEPLSMLGTAQKQWLKEQLLQSTATFKVIISPVPWSFDAKPAMEGRIDTWGGYREERKEIFDFLADHNIGGVLLLSADRHRSDIWKIERPNSYALYEFESSKLTNTHTHQVMPGAVYGYNKKCSFGKLIFDTITENPSVEYQIVNIDNVVVKRFTLPLSALQNAN